MDIPFHTDLTCPSPIVAVSRKNCVGPFSDYANNFLDTVFTAMFGMVGMLRLAPIVANSLTFNSVGRRPAAVRHGGPPETGGGATLQVYRREDQL